MPRIKTTRTVRVALWALRFYLLILLSLIGVKFVRMYSHSNDTSSSATPGTAPERPSDR